MYTEEPHVTFGQLLKRWCGVTIDELKGLVLSKLEQESMVSSGRLTSPAEPGEGGGFMEQLYRVVARTNPGLLPPLPDPEGSGSPPYGYAAIRREPIETIHPFFPQPFYAKGPEKLNHNTGNVVWDVEPLYAVPYWCDDNGLNFKRICFKEAEIERYEKDHPEVFYQIVDPGAIRTSPAVNESPQTLEAAPAEEEATKLKARGAELEESKPAGPAPEGSNAEAKAVSDRLPIPRLLKAIKDEADNRGLSKGYVTSDRTVRNWLNGSSPPKCSFTAEVLRNQETINEFAKTYIADVIGSGSSELAANAKKEITLNEGFHQLKAETPEDVVLLKESIDEFLKHNQPISGRKNPGNSGRK